MVQETLISEKGSRILNFLRVKPLILSVQLNTFLLIWNSMMLWLHRK